MKEVNVLNEVIEKLKTETKDASNVKHISHLLLSIACRLTYKDLPGEEWADFLNESLRDGRKEAQGIV